MHPKGFVSNFWGAFHIITLTHLHCVVCVWPGLFLATLGHAAAAWSFLRVLALQLYAGQFGVYEDTAAVFAHDDLLAHADIELALGRDLVEAATAGVALDVDHGQAVA